MSSLSRRAWLGLACLVPLVGLAPASESDEGFERLFDGKDLTGWRLIEEHPTSMEERGWRIKQENLLGLTVTPDRRFAVKDGAIVCNGGKPLEVIETVRAFPKDFVLRLEFRASPKANSGLFLRGKQLQVRDYLSVGPYKDLKRYRNGDWNAIEVIVAGDSARCTCNGEVLEASFDVKGQGGIGFQAETNVLEYRQIRIKEIR
jgi:hypothetical protein